MNQALLRFSLPPGVTLYASDIKEAVAKACNENTDIPPCFFHYQDGRPIANREPDIRFIGGKGWVGILSREGNTKTLLQIAGIAAITVSQHCGRPVPMQLEEPVYGVEITHHPIKYHFRDVVAKHANRWRGSTSDNLIRMLGERLRNERDRLGLDLPKRDGSDVEDREHLTERLGIRIHETRELGMRLTTAQGSTRQFVRLMSGTLTLYANLQGVWQFGGLQSRGYGRLVLARETR